MDFVALATAPLPAGRCEIAAVARLDGAEARHLFLLGFDALAVRAREHALEGVCVLAKPDLPAVIRALVELSGDAPWVHYGLRPVLEQWREVDITGAVPAVPKLDCGELAALALPLCRAKSLGELLADAAAAGAPLSRIHDPPPGLPFAAATAELWSVLPVVIDGLPAVVRETVAELLDTAGHPLHTVWRQASVRPPAAGEPATYDGLLRARLRRLTPSAPGEERELGEARPIDAEQVAALFADDGPFAALLPGYERREGQQQMARAVAENLNDGRCLLVEAQTGTGKSLAYLAPAAMYALQNGEPVVVSTNTKNLQDQLCRKDIPLLREALARAGGPWSLGLKAELIKGRGNYLCAERLLHELDEANLLAADDDLFFLAYLAGWAAQTETGDLDDLSDYLGLAHPRLLSYARRLASEAEFCTAPQMRDHPCFATVARRRAFGAELLVINHALALANAVTAVLPPFRHLILDEAHNVEDIATEAFGLEVSRRSLLGLTREAGGSREPRALHNRLRRMLTEIGGPANDLLGALTEVEQCAERIRRGIDDYGEKLAGVAMQRLRRAADEMIRREQLRLLPQVYDGALGESLRRAGEGLRDELQVLVAALGEVHTGLTQLAAADLPQAIGALHALRGDWTEQLRGLELLLRLDDDRYVYWLDVVLRREGWDWQLKAAPIEAGESLAEHVWRQMASVSLTSATLAVGGSFDYFAHRLGLTLDGVGDRFWHLAVTSGFDYSSQVLLGLPMNIALPQDERFERHVGRAVVDVARLLGGRTLVLFTAIGMMRRVFETIAPQLSEGGLEPLCQGVSGNRHALAERFRTNPGAVLLGTRSFWEGIDVPGDALQAVVIVKLPFAVPDDPVVAARCERLESQGVNAWTAYSIPQAVILFKQGFGRLIRRVTDKGAVLCLDRRLHEKGYGRAFLKSVPGYSPVFDSWTEVKERLREWLAVDGEQGGGS